MCCASHSASAPQSPGGRTEGSPGRAARRAGHPRRRAHQPSGIAYIGLAAGGHAVETADVAHRPSSPPPGTPGRMTCRSSHHANTTCGADTSLCVAAPDLDACALRTTHGCERCGVPHAGALLRTGHRAPCADAQHGCPHPLSARGRLARVCSEQTPRGKPSPSPDCDRTKDAAPPLGLDFSAPVRWRPGTRSCLRRQHSAPGYRSPRALGTGQCTRRYFFASLEQGGRAWSAGGPG